MREFRLQDDGTLDTVFTCSVCGEEERLSDTSEYRDDKTGEIKDMDSLQEILMEDHECAWSTVSLEDRVEEVAVNILEAMEDQLPASFQGRLRYQIDDGSFHLTIVD